MDKAEFYGDSLILNLTSRKKLSLNKRVINIKTGASNGVRLPATSRMYKVGGPIWYLNNSDEGSALCVYDADDNLCETIQSNQCAIINFSNKQFNLLIRDSSRGPYFPFATIPEGVTITSNQEDFNLRTYVEQETGYDGLDPISLTVTIASGVIIGGTLPTTTAFDTGTWPSGTVIHLYNNGEILGSGGGVDSAEYPGGGIGGKGGDAIKLQANTVLYNENGRICSGGGQGQHYYIRGGIYYEGTGCGGGQGYVGGKGQGGGTNGSPSAPGTTKLGQTDEATYASPDALFNKNFRDLFNAGNGGWWGCAGEEGAYAASSLITDYDSTSDKNADGSVISTRSGAPGIAILNIQFLTVASIGKITGPTADFDSNTYVYYFSELWATNICLGKTLKKIGWNGSSPANVSIYIHSQTTIGHWAQYRPHKKDEMPTPAFGFTADGHYRVQPNSFLIESDWPSGTVISMENHGRIYGGGGLGARPNPQGTNILQSQMYICGPNGGNAVAAYYALTVDNQGIIAGGGGGSGCKLRRTISNHNFWGYTVPTYDGTDGLSSNPSPGSGGAGAGFAYGPYHVGGPSLLSMAESANSRYNPTTGKESTITTGGESGIGYSYKLLGGGSYYQLHNPHGDPGSVMNVDEEWDPDLHEYVDIYEDPVTSQFGSYANTAWSSSWSYSPFNISDSWFKATPSRVTGGTLGQAGSSAETPLSSYYSTGGSNASAGQPGYYMYGGTNVTWINTGTVKGLIGG